ncbi:Rha family transcriptional regulator [Vibrio proteolyticus]|uniref:Uncharacterized protein n=1 Tax=Vibrio proteolyticus NBRC 13287 TaxID=1219065 RepID=U2ZM71_VIBPR|nr:Rha family transcriptional regulator [Vibrio proteolyticus]GAD68841.1 hypothetical protein VPR01S_20_00210 [Vibrio proteolyticus NBRC 13287]
MDGSEYEHRGNIYTELKIDASKFAHIYLDVQNLTMGSREIAELTVKRHDNVRRTIESLWDLSLVSVTQSEEPTIGGGKPTKIYHVNEEDSYIVVARLSPEFTAKIVKRWRELEEANQFKIPQTLPEALLLAAELGGRTKSIFGF